MHKMQYAGMAKPTVTQWVLLLLYVSQKEGSLRFCLQCHQLNPVTVRESYLILTKSRMFLKLVANSRYFEIEINDKDVNKIAILTHPRLFKCTVLPFGLKDSAETFQRAMKVILAPVKWQLGILYSDNIIIFLKAPDEHLRHTAKVLRLHLKAEISNQLKKVFFLHQSHWLLAVCACPREATSTTEDYRSARIATLPNYCVKDGNTFRPV